MEDETMIDELEEEEEEEKLEKKEDTQMEKQVSAHVVTRWYRAPEVILMQLKKKNCQPLTCGPLDVLWVNCCK